MDAGVSIPDRFQGPIVKKTFDCDVFSKALLLTFCLSTAENAETCFDVITTPSRMTIRQTLLSHGSKGIV